MADVTRQNGAVQLLEKWIDLGSSVYARLFVTGGAVASGVAASGNPVPIGGDYNATPSSLTTGQRGTVQIDQRGSMKVAIMSLDGIVGAITASPNADTQSTSSGRLLTTGVNMLLNGATDGPNFDRQRGNGNHTVGITAAGVTTTQTGSDQTNYNGRGIKVILDMTVVGTGSVTLSIQGKDPVSGKYYTILTGAVVNTNSTNVYTIYPGIAAVANAQVNDVLPRTWRVVVTANNANATTYTVGACDIL